MSRNIPFAAFALIVLTVLAGVFTTVDSAAHSRSLADAAPTPAATSETVTWGP